MNLDGELVEVLERFSSLCVAVFGDVMLDRYWYGVANRVSPEAPVPVVLKQRTVTTPGGAGNVAANIRGLGGKCRLVGVVGDDEAASDLRRLLREQDIDPDDLIVDPGRPTTVKTRVIAQGQQVVRIDEESSFPIGGDILRLAEERVADVLSWADVVVVSDYAKGFLVTPLLSRIIQGAAQRKLPVVVDPKGRDYKRYAGATVITPNRLEALMAADVPHDGTSAVLEAGKQLLGTVPVEYVLITQGQDGMTLFSRTREPIHIPTVARSACDVTGAGDTAVATLAIAMAAGLPVELGIVLANYAAGLVVEQVGTVAITRHELRRALTTGRMIER